MARPSRLSAKDYGYSFVEVSHLPRAQFKPVVIPQNGVENFLVRHKGDFRARAFRLALDRKRRLRHATHIFLIMMLSVLVNLDDEPLAQSVDAGQAHAVQTRR